jgi:hypothetical protein
MAMNKLFLSTLIILILISGGTAMAHENSKNVLGTALLPHKADHPTGFYRDGYCRTDAHDSGQHAIAATVTKEFLAFTKARGNDLQTPRPEYGFPGLSPGDNWCLCTARWNEAEKAGVAPPVHLDATDHAALKLVPLDILKKYDAAHTKK